MGQFGREAEEHFPYVDQLVERGAEVIGRDRSEIPRYDEVVLQLKSLIPQDAEIIASASILYFRSVPFPRDFGTDGPVA